MNTYFLRYYSLIPIRDFVTNLPTGTWTRYHRRRVKAKTPLAAARNIVREERKKGHFVPRFTDFYVLRDPGTLGWRNLNTKTERTIVFKVPRDN